MSRLYLGSGGYRTEAMRTIWRDGLDAFLGECRRFVFIPHALREHAQYQRQLMELGFHAGRDVIGLHEVSDPLACLREAEAIFTGGGNSFRLLHCMQEIGVMELISERVRAGVPYIGISAGTNLACPTIMTTNDMPIVFPRSFDALGLLPFQINPHYVDGRLYRQQGETFEAMGGETRDERLREFHEMNDMPVLGLYEGVAMRVEGDRAMLEGERGARLFRRGHEAEAVAPGGDVSSLLAS